MNQHLRHVACDTSNLGPRRPIRPLDQIDAARAAQHLVAYTPTNGEIERLFQGMRIELGSVISLAVVRRVIAANPDTVHAFALRGRHDITNPQAEGFIAWLPLTAAGLEALHDGAFDGADPAPAHIASQHEAPAAIYIWALQAPGRLAVGIAWAFQRWSTPICAAADIYARTVTPSGRYFAERIGFETYADCGDPAHENLMVFRRSRDEDAKPLYDSYPGTTRKCTVTVVRTYDDLAKVMAVRSVAFLAEQNCPYEEEFDGNDFSSTHLLGYVDNELAACLRIRCFADFAKVERLSVLPKHRQSRMAGVLVRAAHELCRMKGYTKVYGHAQKRLVAFWHRAGARAFPGARHFSFSDHDYVEMLAQIPSHPEAIAIGADPLVIIRPEGRWHQPGVLDSSAGRPSTCPAAERRRTA